MQFHLIQIGSQLFIVSHNVNVWDVCFIKILHLIRKNKTLQMWKTVWIVILLSRQTIMQNKIWASIACWQLAAKYLYLFKNIFAPQKDLTSTQTMTALDKKKPH